MQRDGWTDEAWEMNVMDIYHSQRSHEIISAVAVEQWREIAL
jgi:hypothetical protein